MGPTDVTTLAAAATDVATPVAASGAFTMIWLLVGLPLLGAAVLLMAGGAPTGGGTCSVSRCPPRLSSSP